MTRRRHTAGPGAAWACVLALTASAVAGCLSYKESPEQDEIIFGALPDVDIPMIWTEAAEKGTVPDGWLTSFNDEQMEAVVGEALQNNMALRAAASQLEAAAQAAIIAGAQMKPVVAASGYGEALKVSGADRSDSYGAGLNVSWEMDIWGRLRSAATAAEEQFVASAAEFEAARYSLAGQTAKTWYLTTEILQQKQLAEETVAIFERLLRVVEDKKEVGQVADKDVSLARANVAEAKDVLRQAEGAYKQAVRGLEVLLGRYPSAELEVAKDFVPVLPEIPAGVPAQVLERRPDLFAAERRVAAAFQEVRVARLARLPSISLTAAGGGASSDAMDLLGIGPGFFSVGGNFLAPIYAGGALKAQEAIKTASRKAALAAYGQAALIAFQEAETALTNEGLLADRTGFLARAVADNQRAYDLAQEEYDIGKIDLLSVLQHQARVNASKSALIRIKNARLAQRIDLHLALGGSFEMASSESDEAAPVD